MWLLFSGIVLGGLLYMGLFADVMHKDINSLPLVFWLDLAAYAAYIVLNVVALPLRPPLKRSGPGDSKHYLMYLIFGILFIVFSLLNSGRNGASGSTVFMAMTGVLMLTLSLRDLLYTRRKSQI
jgi:hypothetical protein